MEIRFGDQLTVAAGHLLEQNRDILGLHTLKPVARRVIIPETPPISAFASFVQQIGCGSRQTFLVNPGVV